MIEAPTVQQLQESSQPENKTSEQLQEKCRLSTVHSCFISWTGRWRFRFAANCSQTVQLLVWELFTWQIPVLNAPENALLGTDEAFSQDWKFPSCKKHFLFLEIVSPWKMSIEKLIWAFHSLLGGRHLTRKTLLFVNHTIKQLDAAEIHAVSKLTGFHDRWASKKKNTLSVNSACFFLLCWQATTGTKHHKTLPRSRNPRHRIMAYLFFFQPVSAPPLSKGGHFHH